ncbi:MAG TPA: hypothetical protein VGM30_14935 [Puia sp.]|jgi:hypothetical protein
MQTLQGQLGAVTGKIKAEQIENKAKEEKKEPTFHQKELARLSKMTDDRMANVQVAGDTKAAVFFHQLQNASSIYHDAALRDFKNLYGSSEEKARAALMAKAAEESDCHPVERRNVTFETKTLNACRPKGNVTRTDLAHAAILKSSLENEWQKRGYKGTQAVIDAHNAKYGK